MIISEKNNIQTEIALSPEGHVYLNTSTHASELLPAVEFEKISALFAKGPSAGLLLLGIQDFALPLPPSFLFWQTFSRHFITYICKLARVGEAQTFPSIPVPEDTELQEIINQALLIKGIEYLSLDILKKIWQDLIAFLKQELQDFSAPLEEYLHHYNPRWNLVGRICFHLAENKNNEHRPFAFLATYTTQLSQHAGAQHLPLKHALQNYTGEKNQAALLALLLPVQKAANQSPFIKNLVDSGAIFQALTWTANEAYQFLKAIPLMESSGIMVRIPNWWNTKMPPRPKVAVTVGESSHKKVLGLNTLLDFNVHLALNNGEPLTPEEWQSLLNSKDHLVKIKGQWVEVDHKKLEAVLLQWNKLKQTTKNGLSMAEGLRLLAGAGTDIFQETNAENIETIADWSTVVAGDWLKNMLHQLRNPADAKEKEGDKILKQHLQATLRPYQQAGIQWLWLLYQLKLGGCLADDMGLGKTIQIISLLLIIKYHASTQSTRKPHLLVVPASLVGNWQTEINRFAPNLKILIAHPSANNRSILTEISTEQLTAIDLVITTYAFVHRLVWLKNIQWDLLILDEAQLIKNPNTKQTLAVKALKSQVRFTLTGTPIENRLGDLWSLFDFTSPGLLGSSKVFSHYSKKAIQENSHTLDAHFMTTLRHLTQPYILRRLKNDKKIIADLPDKTEMQSFCLLSKTQIDLYETTIQELAQQLEKAEGIQRKGLVLSYLLRFKQICNHPTQWLGYGEYQEKESGKFLRLREICEEIAARQEKVLIFTQFREIIPALSSFLSQIFGREGLILHGDTPIQKRTELVEEFQQEQGPPFFVLSLKAGGTGLNLTRASHVIHFDRWWNPAVENQATDRAYRIGQKHPVLVHKFICRGTIEEKIDALIASKKSLSQEILEGGSEISITELSNDELLHLFSLDIQRALGD
jgi:superfamily II DNA or RNA helicase